MVENIPSALCVYLFIFFFVYKHRIQNVHLHPSHLEEFNLIFYELSGNG